MIADCRLRCRLPFAFAFEFAVCRLPFAVCSLPSLVQCAYVDVQYDGRVRASYSADAALIVGLLLLG
jgi:hypothetical protein